MGGDVSTPVCEIRNQLEPQFSDRHAIAWFGSSSQIAADPYLSADDGNSPGSNCMSGPETDRTNAKILEKRAFPEDSIDTQYTRLDSNQ